MLLRVLGPIEIGDGTVEVHGMPRRLLTALLVDPNRVLSVDRLLDMLWGDGPPATALNTLHSHVSRLRSRLDVLGGRGVGLRTREPGYVLEVDPDELDATRFEQLVREARAAGEPQTAADLFAEALALWRGPAYADFADEEFVRPVAVRLEELRLTAWEERIDALLTLGRHVEILGDVEQLVAENPLREKFREQLMLARHRSGQSAAALRVYREYREHLADELGLEPSAALQRLERDILLESTTTGGSAAVREGPVAVTSADAGQAAGEAAVRVPPADAGPKDPERKLVTVLLAEVDSPATAGGDPEELLDRLEPALTAMRDAVHRYDGTVHRVSGSGVAALFGAPVAQEDHAVRACYAGLALLDAVRSAAGVPARVALESGEVLVRTVRTEVSSQYEAVGAAVGLAEELLQRTLPDSVSASATTVHLAAGRVEVHQAAGERPRRWTVVRATRRTPYEARTLRGLTTFAGRRSELDLLAARLATAGTGHGQVVAVVGEAGVGKSRLCVEFQRRAVGRDWQSLVAAAAPTESRTPYVPLAGMLRSWLGLPDDAPAGVVAAALRRNPATAPRAVPLLALLGVPTGDPAWNALEPGQRRRRIHGAVADLLVDLTAKAPLLVMAEDLHWLDSETDAVLEAVVDSAATSPLLLLTTYRPEYVPPWVNRSHVTTVHLGPLGPGDADRLLTSLLGDDASLSDLKGRLVEWTGGSPLFLEETVSALAEGRVLHGEPGTYRLAERPAAISVPTSVHAVLAARVDRLPPRQKQLLQTAAAIGTSGPLDLLFAAVEVPEEQRAEDLAALRRAEFLFERRGGPEVTFTFKHAITHDAVYASVPRARRRALHRHVAEAIRGRHGAQLDEHVARLGRHALGAEDWADAARLLRRAGEQALDRSAHREAAELLEQAVEALGHLDPTPQTIATELDVRMALRPAVVARGEMTRSLRHLERAEALARRVGDRHRLVTVTIHQSFCHDLMGHVSDAVAAAREGLAIATELGDETLAAEVRLAMAQAYAMSGDARRTLTAIAPSVSLLTGPLRHERHGMAGIRGVWALGHQALAAIVLADFCRAAALADEAAEVARTGGRTVDRAFTSFVRGFLELERGDVPAALGHLSTGEAIARDGDIPLAGMWNRAYLGRALQRAGDQAEAEAVLERLLAQTRATEIVLVEGWVRTHLAELRLAQEDPASAATEAEQAVALAVRWHHPFTHARSLRLLGEAAAAGGDRDGAEARLGAAIGLCADIGAGAEQAHGLLARGLVRARAGDREGTRVDLHDAARAYDAAGMTTEAAAARAELGRLG